ncbi:hypothetical protein C8R44DRAFT_754751 [Mycena epipterygia]|nr:hypothetical protein C8R44DRAFT_754751 [Mycena epipterygia]
MAHEETHHAAASTPESLRHICAHHRKKADGSASVSTHARRTTSAVARHLPYARRPRAYAEALGMMERGHATPRARTFALPRIVYLATLVGVPSAHESPRRTNTLDRDRHTTRVTRATYGGPRTTRVSPAAIASAASAHTPDTPYPPRAQNEMKW